MYCAFYLEYAYYLPHFIPISNELIKRGHKVKYIVAKKQNFKLAIDAIKKLNLEYELGEDALLSDSFDFIFFSNGYKHLNKISAKTIFLEHGIGSKSTSFYPYIQYFDYYLVEGVAKYNTISSLYPNYKDRLHIVGFSKFDTIANMTKDDLNRLKDKYSINNEKTTILYAPTFFPSSIEKMSKDFPNDFKNCNILIKPHYFTLELEKYKKQRKVLEYWSSFKNVQIIPPKEYNIVPFLAISDIMISDESSAMFEFAMLDKPVISNRYFKLRWSYYLFPWKLKQRIDKDKDIFRDIFYNAYSYSDTLKFTKQAIKNPKELSKKRQEASKLICGEIDGKVSVRIVDLLEKS